MSKIHDDRQPVIEVDQIAKTFTQGRDKVEAVRGISFDVKKQEIFGFLGPNGAGKTTSLRMIIGLLQPDSGQVSILGKPAGYSDHLKLLGIIPQELVFYEELTVEENLWFIARLYDLDKEIAKQRIDDLISRLELEDKRGSLARNLSGGLRRRLNIALSLINDPKIVFCDEPTPGLDPQSRVKIWEFIQSLPQEGKTVILTTHFMEEADRLCDRVAIIDHGQILVLNRPEELKESVGKGDYLELTLEETEKINSTIEYLQGLGKGLEDIRQVGSRIQLRTHNLVSKLPELLSLLEEIVQIKDVKLRRTTLEDVFITLTGKQLRD